MTVEHIRKEFRDAILNRVSDLPMIRIEFIAESNGSVRRLDEGKWIDGRFKRGIRIDQPTHLHGAGLQHAHIYGRKGDELVVVNFDGSASHGTRGILHSDDAKALTDRGFTLKNGLIVEWWIVPNSEDFQLLLG